MKMLTPPFAPTVRAATVSEGALNAATAQRFLPEKYVVGNSGVTTSHRDIIETVRRRPLEIAFDTDSFSNPHVARALASLLRFRLADQGFLGHDDDVRILSWDRRIKGIDEALLAGLQFHSLTVREWLKPLTPECYQQANQQLSYE